MKSDRENTPLGDPGQGVGREITAAQESAWLAIIMAEAAHEDDAASKMRRDLTAYEKQMGLRSVFAIKEDRKNEAKRKRHALQAAAPDLLEALEGFVADLTNSLRNRETMLTINHDALVKRIAAARTAIAKVRGE